MELKNTYNLNRFARAEANVAGKKQIVFGISFAGNTSISFSYLYSLLNIKPGQPFDPVRFSQKISELRISGLFKSVDYEIRRVKDDKIKLIIKVDERKKPVIHSVLIKGNTTLPFRFIYRLLGIKPLQTFDGRQVEKRINELYGLGYFETINYEIEPVRGERVRLIIRVKEKPLKRLRLGFHYDDNYKMVASAAVSATNLLLPGLRVDFQIQFAGLTHLNYRISYPSRGLNAPIFPFLRFEYKDRLIDIFEEHGRKIASYHDRFSLGAAGITLLLGKLAVIDLEYNIQKMNVDPSVAFNDPQLFPSWDDQIREIRLDLQIDELDDVIIPKSGIALAARYEESMTRLGSDINYKKYNARFDQYLTTGRNHTFRLNVFYTWGSDDLPVYKYDFRGGPNSFVGMDYNQVSNLNFASAGLDYRYRYKKDIYFKLIGNGGRILKAMPQTPNPASYISGFGIAVKFLSIIGPFEFIFSRGPRSYTRPLKMRNMVYFQAGFKLN